MTKGGKSASVKREVGAAGTIASSDLAFIAKERRVGSPSNNKFGNAKERDCVGRR
jgi:hypothetical protein